jgi:hypothetical protein
MFIFCFLGLVLCVIGWVVGLMRLVGLCIILLGGENISFVVGFVMYINSTLGALGHLDVELEDYHMW